MKWYPMAAVRTAPTHGRFRTTAVIGGIFSVRARIAATSYEQSVTVIHLLRSIAANMILFLTVLVLSFFRRGIMYHLCDWHGTMPASAWRLVDAQHQACGAGLTS